MIFMCMSGAILGASGKHCFVNSQNRACDVGVLAVLLKESANYGLFLEPCAYAFAHFCCALQLFVGHCAAKL